MGLNLKFPFSADRGKNFLESNTQFFLSKDVLKESNS